MKKDGNNIGSLDTIVYTIVNPPDRCTKRLLNAGDTLLSLLIISPLVVAHWRGTWVYMDHHAEHFPAWNCFIFGGVLHSAFALLREQLHSQFVTSNKKNKSFLEKLKLCVIFKLYTYIFSISCNMHWRGGWAVLEMYFGIERWPAIYTSIICFIGLIIFKSVRNLIAPPVIILTDAKEFSFAFPTRFRIEGTREPGLYILDCLFSVLFIGSLVVFVWRGVWVWLDITLYPEDKGLSGFGSLIIGYGVVGITFLLQPLMKWACERLEGTWRIIVADIFIFFSFVGTINVWRGVWNLLDVYFLPENHLLSDLITHGVSLILLALLNCSNSVLVRGVYIDAEEPAGKCVIFPVYYVRLFFQKERTKKQRRFLDALEKDHNNILPLIEKGRSPSNHAVIVKSSNCSSNHHHHHHHQLLQPHHLTSTPEKSEKSDYDNTIKQ